MRYEAYSLDDIIHSGTVSGHGMGGALRRRFRGGGKDVLAGGTG